MKKGVALEVFDLIERRSYDYQGDDADGPMDVKLFNVRLDALTEGVSLERDYRLFVRIDNEVPSKLHAEAITYLMATAQQYDLFVSLENGGVELTK